MLRGYRYDLRHFLAWYGNRIIETSDLELGLQALLGNLPAAPALTRPSTLRAIRYRTFSRRRAFWP